MTLSSQSSSEKLMELKEEGVSFLLESTATLYLNQEILTLNKGNSDSVKIPAYMKHKWENPYKEKAILFFAITPPSF